MSERRCKEMTLEMTWQEVLHEYRKLITHEEIMNLSPQERVIVSCAMFEENRVEIIASLPKDLSPNEMRRQIFERTYGYPLPDDFPNVTVEP
jgi:hypothetical protein